MEPRHICVYVNINFYKVKEVVLMLCGMIFVFDKVVALHLDNSTANAYAIKVVQSILFLSRLACNILNLDYKHDVTLIPAYIPT